MVKKKSQIDIKNVAGMSLRGGRRDNFIFCLIEFYPDQNRWFLKSLLQVKDEEGVDGDDAIRSWIEKYKLHQMVVDFPLSEPACQTCQLACPGQNLCPVKPVVRVREEMERLLTEDQKLVNKNPKRYEQERNLKDEVDITRDILGRTSDEHLLSRSFKRRLKKGFLPYWNRPIDFWVWQHYYDQLLDVFNISYDSYGNTSLMTQARFIYLKRHFPDELTLYEGHVQLTMLELMRAGVIHKRDIVQLSDIEMGLEARLDIIKKIESGLKVFIYDHDLEILVKNPRAFESFILAIVGQNIHLKQNHEIPNWALEGSKFVVPSFL